MANPGMPTVRRGDTGEAVAQAQRGLRRTPNLGLEVDGDFGPATEAATKEFQQQAGLAVTGVVDAATWEALPSGLPMPVLRRGDEGDVVRNLQTILTMGAAELWKTTPQGVDGEFGGNTEASVRAFQAWARIGADGVVGAQTWSALGALEFVVGIQHAAAVEVC
ncbi:peptidoglycan-binding protein [Dactylosporangium sp. NPDC051541]|uniref:peptidoglycan-binding protein n=1 Tax=Dactylosporangium sp. NPDC051541 TaxID=3363977 RepID=UPI0037A5D6A2